MYNIYMSNKHGFDESKFKLRSRRLLGKPEVPAVVKFLVVKGVVKTEVQAVAFVAAIFIAVFSISVCLLHATTVPIATLDKTLSASTH